MGTVVESEDNEKEVFVFAACAACVSNLHMRERVVWHA